MTQKRIGRYSIERVLGRGGMGTVYLAFDSQLQVHRAIKVVPADQPTHSLPQRLLHEAQLAALSKHPNIVSIYETGVESGSSYIVIGVR